MSESFPINRIETPQDEPKPEVPKQGSEIDAQAVEEFLDKEAEILTSYGFKGEISVEFGPLPNNVPMGFSAENRTIRIDKDSSFFTERKYSLRETLFVVAHEIMSHYSEMFRDPEFVLPQVKRYQAKANLHLLHNIFEDVMGNRRIVAELPFLEDTKTNLYRESQFPQTDYTQNASHVQFVYGFIRQMMVPGEAVQLGPEAQAALDKLRSFG